MPRGGRNKHAGLGNFLFTAGLPRPIRIGRYTGLETKRTIGEDVLGFSGESSARPR